MTGRIHLCRAGYLPDSGTSPPPFTERVATFRTKVIAGKVLVHPRAHQLAAAILLLMPRTVFFGAAISLGVISGAIVSHLTRLGSTLPAVGDRGELFAFAVAVFLCSAAVAILHRRDVAWLSN